MLRWRSSISRRVRSIGPTISPAASAVSVQIGQLTPERLAQPPLGTPASVSSAPRTATGARTGYRSSTPEAVRTDAGPPSPRARSRPGSASAPAAARIPSIGVITAARLRPGTAARLQTASHAPSGVSTRRAPPPAGRPASAAGEPGRRRRR